MSGARGALLALTVSLASCAGTGPSRPLHAYLSEQHLRPDAPVVLVDIDDTIYERAAEQPMVGAVDALRDLSEDHLIVYLTARPTLFKVPGVTENRRDSLEFLAEHDFPAGPLFTSSLWNFLFRGQGGGKVQSFRQLREFGVERVQLAVGDRPHDLAAYLDNGYVDVDSAVIVLIEDASRADPDRGELPEVALRDPIPGGGAAWPRILDEYESGRLAGSEARVVTQPPGPR